MDIYRTDVSASRQDLFTQFVNIMGNYDWYDTSSTSSNAKFYINSTQYIDVSDDGSYFTVTLYNGASAAAGDSIVRSEYGGNASLYINGDAMVICFSFGGYNGMPTTYSFEARFIVDKINNDISIVYNLIDNNNPYVYVLNSNIGNSTLYRPFAPEKSIVNHTDTAQFVHYLDVVSGEEYNTIYGILITPLNNCIVDKSGEKWLFTSGFAIPCGSTTTYHYYNR